MTVPMNASRDKFLTRAAFSGYHYGCFGCGDLADFFQYLLHTLATAHDAFGVIRAVKQALVGFLGADRIFSRFESLRDQLFELLQIEGLQHVIEGSVFHCLDRSLAGSESGHQNNHGRGSGGSEMLESFDSRDALHPIVEKNQVRFFAPSRFDPLLTGIGGHDGITFLGKNAVKRIPNLGIVVDQKDCWL